MALDDGRVVSNFLTQALTGKPLTIYGDGQQTRSFQYISDLIAGTNYLDGLSNFCSISNEYLTVQGREE